MIGCAGQPTVGYPPGTKVWRRIPPRHFPKKEGQLRPDSAAFEDDAATDPMSVVVARDGRSPLEILKGHDGYGLVELNIEDLIHANQYLQADPLPNEPDHALVVGPKTLSCRRTMAKSSRWIVDPRSEEA